MGEIVFRKLPAFARPAKHLLGDRCQGPFIVVNQRSYQSAVLRDPATGELVDIGRNIPLLVYPSLVVSAQVHLKFHKCSFGGIVITQYFNTMTSQSYLCTGF
jgi:hypothetical protein